MLKSIRPLEELQSRVAHRDVVVARELSQRLEPAVACAVRRALRFPGQGSPLEAAVRAEVHILGLTARGVLLAEDRQIVRLITGRISADLFNRLRFPSARLPAEETLSDLTVHCQSIAHEW